MKIISKSAAQTRKIGEKLSRFLKPPSIIGFSGELGAGKTTFISGIAKGLKIKEKIISPTFIIIKKYEGMFEFAHIDLYRINRLEEIESLEIKDLLKSEYIIAIEWIEKIEKIIKSYLKIKMEQTDKKNERVIEFIALGEEYRDIVRKLSETIC